jgi:methylmalonyl-CoA decarboxylase
MLFTARTVPAERALLLGMINAIVPKADLERSTLEIAAQVAETSPMCVALIKEELRILSQSRPISAETFERLQGLRRNVYDSHDYQEGIRSFLEKRRPLFTGK